MFYRITVQFPGGYPTLYRTVDRTYAEWFAGIMRDNGGTAIISAVDETA